MKKVKGKRLKAKAFFVALVSFLLSAFSLQLKAQETPPTGLKPVNGQFYINLTDSSIWHYKGAPYGWERLARYKDIIAGSGSIGINGLNGTTNIGLGGNVSSSPNIILDNGGLFNFTVKETSGGSNTIFQIGHHAVNLTGGTGGSWGQVNLSSTQSQLVHNTSTVLQQISLDGTVTLTDSKNVGIENGADYSGSYATHPLALLQAGYAASTYQPILGFTPYNATNPNNYIPLTALSATSPIFYNSSTGVISSQAATNSVNGYLTAADHATFNGKQNAITTGSTSQYIRGDLSLATFPTIPTTSNYVANTTSLQSSSNFNISGIGKQTSSNNTISIGGVTSDFDMTNVSGDTFNIHLDNSTDILSFNSNTRTEFNAGEVIFNGGFASNGDVDINDHNFLNVSTIVTPFGPTVTTGATYLINAPASGPGPQFLQLTGSTSETVQLPSPIAGGSCGSCSLVPNLGPGVGGQTYTINNVSSGTITVVADDNSTVQIMGPNTSAEVIYNGTAGYTNASWNVIYYTGGSGGGITALTNDVTASGSGSVAATVVQINGITKNYYDPTSSIQTQLNAKQPQLSGSGYVKFSSTTPSYAASIPTSDLSGTLLAAQEPAHTGDVTNSAGSLGLTLVTVNSNVGSFVNPNFTVNAKGLITAAASTTGAATSTQITRETPSGAINSSNTVYTLANPPLSGSEQVYKNGFLMNLGGGNDYTISGGTITFNTAPTTGSVILVTYSIASATSAFTSLSLTTPNVIFATPINFSNTAGVGLGTLSLNTQTARTMFGNHTGSTASPTFAVLNNADLPTIAYSNGGSNATTSWTQGSVFFAGASAFAEDNANLFYDSTNHRLGVGTASPLTQLHIVSTISTSPRGIISQQSSTDAVGARITMYKNRGTPGSPTAVTSSDVLGSFTAAGYDGTNFVDAGKLLITTNAAVSTGIVPTKMDLQTMNASGALVTGLSIDQSQNVSITNPVLGTSSTIGYVWTATNTAGAGSWQAAGGGGSGTTTFSLTAGSTLRASTGASPWNGGAAATYDIDLTHANTWTNQTFTTPVINGLPTGTGVSSSATASALMAMDANSNISPNDAITGATTTVTAAGTTTLTISSTPLQIFTGSTTQTVVLPVTSTLVFGKKYTVKNNSTGIVTVQSSGANSVLAVPAGTSAEFTCILTSGTTAASWNQFVNGFTSVSGTGSVVLNTSPTFQTTITANAVINMTKTIAATSSDGITIGNAQAATSGVPQQIGPRIRLFGNAWDGSATKVADWIIENKPVNGTNPITSSLIFSSQINSGGYTPRFIITVAGVVNISNLTASKLVFTDASKNLTSTGIGTSSQLIAGDGSLITPYSLTASHTIFTPTTGGTVTLVTKQENIVNPAGTLATLTLTLPSSPANNDVVYLTFTQAITSITYSGGTVVGGPTSASLGGQWHLTYDSGTTTWY